MTDRQTDRQKVNESQRNVEETDRQTDRQKDRQNELSFGYKQLTYNGDRLVAQRQGDLSFPADPAHHFVEDSVDGDGFVGEGGVSHLDGVALAILHSDPRLK